MSKSRCSKSLGGGVSSFSLLLLGLSRLGKNLLKTPVFNNNYRKHLGFTLAEVLITLGIIGVVAAMTMPTLVQKYEEKATVTKVKKVYSILSQAFMLAVNEHGTLDNWGLAPSLLGPAESAGPKIKPYLKVVDDCGVNDCENYSIRGGHFYALNGKIYPSSNYNNDYKLKLSDGTELSFRESGTSNVSILADINGNKQPNTLGKDIFVFDVSSNGKIIMYTESDPKDTSSFTSCNPKREGWCCAAWVIYNENMDYLRCADELSWNGKTKCK